MRRIMFEFQASGVQNTFEVGPANHEAASRNKADAFLLIKFEHHSVHFITHQSFAFY